MVNKSWQAGTPRRSLYSRLVPLTHFLPQDHRHLCCRRNLHCHHGLCHRSKGNKPKHVLCQIPINQCDVGDLSNLTSIVVDTIIHHRTYHYPPRICKLIKMIFIIITGDMLRQRQTRARERLSKLTFYAAICWEYRYHVICWEYRYAKVPPCHSIGHCRYKYDTNCDTSTIQIQMRYKQIGKINNNSFWVQSRCQLLIFSNL